jgi:putative endonuclease
VTLWFVYILRCSDGTLYTGYTNDVESRLKKHNAGKGAKYTRSRLPVEVLFTSQWGSKSLAMRCEADIKKKTRAQKLALIADRDEWGYDD